MKKDDNVYKEMGVKPPQKFDNIFKWYDYVVDHQNNILDGVEEAFDLDMVERKKTNIANFSCLPWIDFDSITPAVAYLM